MCECQRDLQVGGRFDKTFLGDFCGALSEERMISAPRFLAASRQRAP